jgi:hypothetical protein
MKSFILKSLFLLLLTTSYLCSKAQNLEEDTVKRDSTSITGKKPRTVFLELGGPGLAITANYDTRFGNIRNRWGYRIGIGYYNTGANSVFTIPFQVNYLYGKGNNFLEMGAGTTFLSSKGSTNGVTFQFDDVTGFIGTITLGYRYQQDNGGMNFRLAFVPILSQEGITPGGGLSVGYTF